MPRTNRVVAAPARHAAAFNAKTFVNSFDKKYMHTKAGMAALAKLPRATKLTGGSDAAKAYSAFKAWADKTNVYVVDLGNGKKGTAVVWSEGTPGISDQGGVELFGADGKRIASNTWKLDSSNGWNIGPRSAAYENAVENAPTPLNGVAVIA